MLYKWGSCLRCMRVSGLLWAWNEWPDAGSNCIHELSQSRSETDPRSTILLSVYYYRPRSPTTMAFRTKIRVCIVFIHGHKRPLQTHNCSLSNVLLGYERSGDEIPSVFRFSSCKAQTLCYVMCVLEPVQGTEQKTGKEQTFFKKQKRKWSILFPEENHYFRSKETG